MKAQLIASLSALTLATLAGCSDDSDPSGDTEGSTSMAGGAGPTTMGAGSTAGAESGAETTTGASTGAGPGTSSGPGSEAGSSSESGTHETTSDTDCEPSTVEEICEAFEVVYDECLYPQYAREEFCDDYTLGLLSAGDDCANGFLDHYACLSELDCAALNDESEVPCRDEYASAHETCPEFFGWCGAANNGYGVGTCFYDFWWCLDDATYRLECESMGGGSTCSCFTDGVASGSFELDTNDPHCYGPEYAEGAETMCGFPTGVVALD